MKPSGYSQTQGFLSWNIVVCVLFESHLRSEACSWGAIPAANRFSKKALWLEQGRVAYVILSALLKQLLLLLSFQSQTIPCVSLQTQPYQLPCPSPGKNTGGCLFLLSNAWKRAGLVSPVRVHFLDSMDAQLLLPSMGALAHWSWVPSPLSIFCLHISAKPCVGELERTKFFRLKLSLLKWHLSSSYLCWNNWTLKKLTLPFIVFLTIVFLFTESV